VLRPQVVLPGLNFGATIRFEALDMPAVLDRSLDWDRLLAARFASRKTSCRIPNGWEPRRVNLTRLTMQDNDPTQKLTNAMAEAAHLLLTNLIEQGRIQISSPDWDGLVYAERVHLVKEPGTATLLMLIFEGQPL
jgi:hypothetical protein